MGETQEQYEPKKSAEKKQENYMAYSMIFGMLAGTIIMMLVDTEIIWGSLIQAFGMLLGMLVGLVIGTVALKSKKKESV